MKRTNTFAVRPLTDGDEQVLRDLLDASAALWNEINYQRLMRYNDEDGFEDEDVWDADTGALEGKYKGVLGASTAQTVRRANTEAWRSFFEIKKASHDESNTSVTEHPEPPGFRGNQDDGRVLKGVVRKDAYTVEWGTAPDLRLSSENNSGIGTTARKVVSGWKSLAVPTGLTTTITAGWTCGTTRLTAPSELRNP